MNENDSEEDYTKNDSNNKELEKELLENPSINNTYSNDINKSMNSMNSESSELNNNNLINDNDNQPKRRVVFNNMNFNINDENNSNDNDNQPKRKIVFNNMNFNTNDENNSNDNDNQPKRKIVFNNMNFNTNDENNSNDNDNQPKRKIVFNNMNFNNNDENNSNDNIINKNTAKKMSSINSKKSEDSFEKNLLYNIDFEKTANIIELISENVEKSISILSDDMNILQRATFLNKINSVKSIIKELQQIFSDEDINKFYNFLNSKNKRGYTSLHYSIICGHIEIYKFLIKNGADRNVLTNSGYNNLILACQTKKTYIFLEEIKNQMVNKQLDLNLLFNIKDKNNATLLHWAAFSDYLFGVQFLLSLNDKSSKNKNINFNNFINSKDNNNLTALQYALMNNSNKVISDLILLDDIDLYNKDNDDRDCFDYADAMANEKFNDIIKIKNTMMLKYKRIIYIVLFIIFNILEYFIVMPTINKIWVIIFQLILDMLLIIKYLLIKFIINPGFKKGNKNIFNSILYEMDEDNIYKELTEISKYCPYCYLKKEKINIIHCPICNTCVENSLKHDIFLNKCISKKNYFIYILLKIIFIFYLLFSIVISFSAIFSNKENNTEVEFPLIKYELFYNEKCINIFCFATIFIFIWVFLMKIWELYKECRLKNNNILAYSQTWDNNNKLRQRNSSKVSVQKMVKTQ